VNFSIEKLAVISFQKCVGLFHPLFFLVNRLIIFFVFLSINFPQAKKGLKIVCNPGTVGIQDYTLSKKRRVNESTQDLYFWRFRQTIAKYI